MTTYLIQFSGHYLGLSTPLNDGLTRKTKTTTATQPMEKRRLCESLSRTPMSIFFPTKSLLKSLDVSRPFPPWEEGSSDVPVTIPCLVNLVVYFQYPPTSIGVHLHTNGDLYSLRGLFSLHFSERLLYTPRTPGPQVVGSTSDQNFGFTSELVLFVVQKRRYRGCIRYATRLPLTCDCPETRT